MKREISWKATVLAAFILVGIVCIVMASVKSCRAEEKEPEPTPAVELVSDADEFAEIAEDEVVEDEPVAVECEIPPRHRVGRCRLTVYNAGESSWGYATATGAKSQHLMTCAVDPRVIPYGSIVIVVDKDGEEWRFRAVDCGNFRGNWIDIFFDDSEKHGIEWLDEVFGGDYGEVYWEEEYCPAIEFGDADGN